MLEKVRRTIRQYRMIQPGDRVVVAVSGGPDSVALAHVLLRLRPELDIALHLFHLHHGLRGEEADADAAYVEHLAREWGVPCTVCRADVARAAREWGTGVEAAGRAIRYRELGRLAARWGARRIATGHQRDDQAETVLLQLLRGAGPQGLAGIPPVRPAGPEAPPDCTVIRPLIAVSRVEVEAYCREHGLRPRVDRTNADPAFLRNRIRHQLLPMLRRDYNPQVAERLAELAVILRAENEYMEAAARTAWERHRIAAGPEGVRLPRAALVGEPPAIARRLLRMAAGALGATIGLAHVDAVMAAAEVGTGSQELDLPGGLRATVEYGDVLLHRRQGTDAGPGFTPATPLRVPGVTEVPALGVRILAQRGPAAPAVEAGPWAVALDPSRLPGPLVVRSRLPGDRIWPVGMAGSKKLQDLLVDLKIPRFRRDTLPVVAAGGEVVWLPGIRADRRFLAPPGAEGVVLLAEPLGPEPPE